MISKFIRVSNLLLLEGAPELFSIALVSLPQYAATPMAQLVFLSSHPRSTMLEDPSDNFLPSTSMLARNPYMFLLGFSHLITPPNPSLPCVSCFAYLVFKFDSPSRLIVCTYATPVGSLVESNTISQGMGSFALIFITSPTLISLQLFSKKFPSTKTDANLLFSTLSLPCLLQSSYASFTAVTNSTKDSGKIETALPKTAS
ncbi:hypothetical protein V8G54_026693 [Vigna mungo]|uniref:Uncharacterized protein n=1 Tax=Vigna mungo TaxID=3915 RepID=A0AAQ3RMD8_VIGMU